METRKSLVFLLLVIVIGGLVLGIAVVAVGGSALALVQLAGSAFPLGLKLLIASVLLASLPGAAGGWFLLAGLAAIVLAGVGEELGLPDC